jgi:hypothetical protein
LTNIAHKIGRARTLEIIQSIYTCTIISAWWALAKIHFIFTSFTKIIKRTIANKFIGKIHASSLVKTWHRFTIVNFLLTKLTWISNLTCAINHAVECRATYASILTIWIWAQVNLRIASRACILVCTITSKSVRNICASTTIQAQ